MSNLAVFVPVLLLATFVRDVRTDYLNDALRYNNATLECWTCSPTYHQNECRDEFSPWSILLKKCKHDPAVSVEPGWWSCKKERRIVNGYWQYTRGCLWHTNPHDIFTPQCPKYHEKSISDIPSFCEVCIYDACNGAATIGKTIALLLAPLGLLLFK